MHWAHFMYGMVFSGSILLVNIATAVIKLMYKGSEMLERESRQNAITWPLINRDKIVPIVNIKFERKYLIIRVPTYCSKVTELREGYQMLPITSKNRIFPSQNLFQEAISDWNQNLISQSNPTIVRKCNHHWDVTTVEYSKTVIYYQIKYRIYLVCAFFPKGERFARFNRSHRAKYNIFGEM